MWGAVSWLWTWCTACESQASQWAVVVGVGRHPVAEWRLCAPLNDIILMRDLCLRWGVSQGNLITLTDRKATRGAVLGAFKALAKKATCADTVIFYFSGHGVQVADVFGPARWRGDEARRAYADLDDEALVLADSVPGNPGSFLVDDELAEAFEPFLDKKVALWCILDCCFAYDGTKAVVPWAGSVKTLAGAPGFEEAIQGDQQAGGETSKPANVLDLGCDILVAACSPEQAVREVWWLVKGHRVAISPLTFALWEAATVASSWTDLSRNLQQAHRRLGLWWRPCVSIGRASWLPCKFVDTSPLTLYDKSGGRITASRAELLACIRRKSFSAQGSGTTFSGR
ncbi:MAG: caspase family protein [Armatimonadetes bacterium]|nr:caspase family protein [Armatimonadota bacterium]